MNKLKLLILPLSILISLFSCSDSDKDVEIEKEPAKAILSLQIESLYLTIKHLINDEVITDVEHKPDDFTQLVYVIHRADDGQFIKYQILTKEEIADLIEDNVIILKDDNLPFGRYYITLIAPIGDKLEKSSLESLTLNYFKAACRIPNNYIYYKTMEVDCTPPHGMLPEYIEEDIEFTAKAFLQVMTGEFNFLLPKGSKDIPKDANFNMKIEITDLPSAFFIETGKTLNNKEMQNLNLEKYNKTFEITKPFNEMLTTKFFLLANNELENNREERGHFKFVYKEDAESDMVTKLYEFTMEERMSYTHGMTLIIDLYSSLESLNKKSYPELTDTE